MPIALFAAIAPFVIWPIETVFPYPHVIEELVKAALVLFILKTPKRSDQITLAAASGVLFAASESVFYLFNISLVGGTGTLLTRLALTIPLHVGTMILMALNLPLGLPVAILGHYFFNSWVAAV